ncbi:MAG: cob(I)yrinic acid a,c-diamide adenosyltransferase [Chlamydiales bacterium]|nr:cob(I)yrinic acid a,c-diamide adenosyltransferase [Chlamydiales bacterium]
MVKIYTKTGDAGETSLCIGGRIPKDHVVVEAIGTVDECNSAIGAAIALLPKELETEKEQLETVQHALFDLGAALATPLTKASEAKKKRSYFDSHAAELLEKWIDAMEEKLPKLTYFILPGGHPSAGMIHVARSICRRAERRVLPLHKQSEVAPEVFVYLNRLSDYLFVLSRYVNQSLHCPETRWEQHKSI